MPQGQGGRQPKNLSVLFLDRSPGPWYRWALEWRQDSDLKNSSGFCGPGSAPLQEMWHEPVRTKIREKQSWLLWWSSTAANCQWTQTSLLATFDLLKLMLHLSSGKHLFGKLKSSYICDAVNLQPGDTDTGFSLGSVGCQTAMFTNILPPLTA